MTPWQQALPDHQWDAQLFAAGGHFTQSSHWAAVQLALDKQVYFASGEGWQCMAILEKGKLGGRLYCPYGPTVSSRAGFKACMDALKQLAGELKVAYVRVEPQGKLTAKQLKAGGLRPAPRDIQPKFTWVKDLTQPADKLLSEMTSTNRNLHNTAAKKGLSFYASHDPSDLRFFLDMIHEVARRNDILPHTDAEFTAIANTLLPRKAAALYFAVHNNKTIASALVYDSPTTRYYAHAASYHESRKLHPGTPLLIRMILDAKTNKQQQFDFFGIAPPNTPNHRWAGFTTFKQSFGGQQKEFLGTWELPTKPLHYAAYRLAHKAKKILP